MASTEKPVEESGKSTEPEAKVSGGINLFSIDLFLRILLFASAVTAVIVMVTSKQTKPVPLPFPALKTAKFSNSPALIYFVAALSVAALYSIISILASLYDIWKPCRSNNKLLLHFVFIDTVMLGIVASATGAAGGVAYIGLKGNSHVGWGKVCSLYDKYCRYIGSSIAISLFAAILLVVLVILSTFTLYRRIH